MREVIAKLDGGALRFLLDAGSRRFIFGLRAFRQIQIQIQRAHFRSGNRRGELPCPCAASGGVGRNQGLAYPGGPLPGG